VTAGTGTTVEVGAGAVPLHTMELFTEMMYTSAKRVNGLPKSCSNGGCQ
jgi:hypothetical protein